jgi:hypothetical protein
MKVSPSELELATTLAARLCTIALHSDLETFRAYAMTEIAIALARHRRRCGSRCEGHGAAFV